MCVLGRRNHAILFSKRVLASNFDNRLFLFFYFLLGVPLIVMLSTTMLENCSANFSQNAKSSDTLSKTFISSFKCKKLCPKRSFRRSNGPNRCIFWFCFLIRWWLGVTGPCCRGALLARRRRRRRLEKFKVKIEKFWPQEIWKLCSKIDVREIKSFQKSTLAPLKIKFSP